MEATAIAPVCATPSGALFGEVTMHCRVIRLSVPGTAGEMETEIVTTVDLNGAIKMASEPGNMEVMPPSLASQLIIVLGGMTPLSVNDSSLPASILQSSGRMVSEFVGIATALVGRSIENANKTATMRTTLRDINFPCFDE
jgi:hypothetical protein